MNKRRIRIFLDTSTFGHFTKNHPQQNSIDNIKEYITNQLNKIIYK